MTHDPRDSIVRIFERSTVGDRAKTFLGTGFLISHEHVVTCRHVLKKVQVSALWLVSAAWHGGGRNVLRSELHPTRDVAVLEIDSPDADAKYLRLTTRELAAGANLTTTAFGFYDSDGDPNSSPLRVTSYDGPSMTHTLQPALPLGMSGSPALLEEDVWGILQARNADRSASYIVPVRAVSDLLRKYARDSPGLRTEAVNQELFAVTTRLFPPLAHDIMNLHTAADVEAFDRFLRPLLRVITGGGEEAPAALGDVLAAVRSEAAPVLVRVSGAQGTGKSATLAILHVALQLNEVAAASLPVVFLDANRYLPNALAAGSAGKRIQIDVDRILQPLNDGDTRPCVVIIDGLSNENRFASALLRAIFDRVTPPRLKAIVAGVSGSFDATLDSVLAEYELSVARQDFRLVPYVVQSQTVGRFLSDFVGFQARVRSEVLDDAMRRTRTARLELKLKQAAFSTVDMHLLTIIASKLEDPAYAAAHSPAAFLERYCKERLGSQVDGDGDARLAEAAEIAYRVTVTLLDRDKAAKLYPGVRKEKGQPVWDLLDEHGNFRDFLAACRLVALLCESGGETPARRQVQDGALGFDFPDGVNQFVKSIINDDPEKQNLAFKSVRGLYQAADQPTRGFFCYVLGRFENPGAQANAETFLLERKKDCLLRLQQHAMGASEIELQVELRTIYVSLIYLRHKGASRDYIDHMLAEPLAAAVNRGFHRVYYGDVEADRTKDQHSYVDDEKGSWSKSFEALVGKIERHLSAEKESNVANQDVLFEVHLFTLISFAQSRFIRGRLPERHREKTEELIRRSVDQVDNDSLRAFADSFGLELRHGEASKWQLVLDLYRLKTNLRQGWVRRRMGSDVSGRVESVAEHTHLACLLAWFLLPELIEGAAGYDKRRVIDMLLVHDIAEAFIGDHVVIGLTPPQRQLYDKGEMRAMRYIWMKDTLDGVYGGLRAYKTWRDFEEHARGPQENLNAALAKDIDRLENFIQLHLYRERLDESEWQKFQLALAGAFQTSLVKEIARDFQVWAERSHMPTDELQLEL